MKIIKHVMRAILLKSLFLLFVLFSSPVFSQIDSVPLHKHEEPKDKPDFLNKCFYGGNLGLQFGTVTFIDVSPLVGYKITPKISAGIGATYQYYHYHDAVYNFETNVYGGRVFGRYYFTKSFFAHAEDEYLNLQAFDYYLPHRVDVNSFLAGGGYIQRFGRNAAFVAMILYNFTPTIYTPYQNPIIRLGINIGF
jgi:hypothetical protein